MPELRYELESLVTVATFSFPWEAELARARLASEGVEAMVTDEHLSRLYCANMVGGIKLQVRSDEADRAVVLLREAHPIPEIYLVTEEDAALRRCPECRSENLDFERWSRVGLVGSWLLLGIALPLPRNRWVCRDCRSEWREEDFAVRGEDREETDEPAEAAEPKEPMEDAEMPGELVTVARFTTPWEAHLARTLLESEGIEACVLEERLPPVDLLTGKPLALNRLAVNEADAEAAREILERPSLLQDLDETGVMD
jgi:hypothetical protein